MRCILTYSNIVEGFNLHSMDDYFFQGKMTQCLAAAQQALAKNEEVARAQKYIALCEQYEYAKYPQITVGAMPQSVERSDESYSEFDEVERIRAIKDEVLFQQRIAELEAIARDGSSSERATSFALQGQLFLLSHHYPEAVHCFQQAVFNEPNKALYWGLTGQSMHRFGWMPFDALGFLEQAIALDATNARWQWNQALVLLQLAKDLQEPAFLANASLVLEQALTNCRAEQKSLQAAIKQTYDEMENYVFNC